MSGRFLLQVTGHRSQVTGHRLQVTGLKTASVEFAVTYNSDGVMSEKYNMGECNRKIFNT